MGQRLQAEEFCRGVRPRLVGVLSLYCGDVQVAEDVAQDALAKVWARWGHVSGLASPEGWAFRVAFNQANSWFRSSRRSRARERRSVTSSVSRSSDVAEAVAVREAVSSLPRRQAQVLVLRFFEDLSVAETARLMGCAQGTVKALTSKAVQRLRGDPLLAGLDDLEVHDVS